jgi:uncharacterized protein YndB with AHSA1/START domain
MTGPAVSGRLRIDIEDGGTQFWVSGEYLVLDRPSRLSFSWSCSTIEHTLLPPGLVGQHERGCTAIAQQLADELAP